MDWRHRAITWTSVDVSLVWFRRIHLRAISQHSPIILYNENYTFEITATSVKGQWVKGWMETNFPLSVSPQLAPNTYMILSPSLRVKYQDWEK